MAGFRRIPDTEPDIRSIPSTLNTLIKTFQYLEGAGFDVAKEYLVFFASFLVAVASLAVEPAALAISADLRFSCFSGERATNMSPEVRGDVVSSSSNGFLLNCLSMAT